MAKGNWCFIEVQYLLARVKVNVRHAEPQPAGLGLSNSSTLDMIPTSAHKGRICSKCQPEVVEIAIRVLLRISEQ
jgi:hypothetical protein